MDSIGKFLDEYEVGETFRTPGRTVTEADVMQFAGLTGDYNELHTNAEFMAKSYFGKRIVHGLLGLSVSAGLFSRIGIFEGTVIAFLGIEAWKFEGPIFFNDTLYAKLSVIEVKPSRKKLDRGVLCTKVTIWNQDGEITQSGRMAFMVKRKKQ